MFSILFCCLCYDCLILVYSFFCCSISISIASSSINNLSSYRTTPAAAADDNIHQERKTKKPLNLTRAKNRKKKTSGILLLVSGKSIFSNTYICIATTRAKSEKGTQEEEQRKKIDI